MQKCCLYGLSWPPLFKCRCWSGQLGVKPSCCQHCWPVYIHYHWKLSITPSNDLTSTKRVSQLHQHNTQRASVHWAPVICLVPNDLLVCAGHIPWLQQTSLMPSLMKTSGIPHQHPNHTRRDRQFTSCLIRSLSGHAKVILADKVRVLVGRGGGGGVSECSHMRFRWEGDIVT